ncbi:hypothetical protein RD110_25940 [Rhodoferax koreense]|uniref:Uncharacterized protein n=1 Tax=Rhodoferax koreensis TaxID=1842727 RepID=A0A1P8K2H8_9BURK|nr:hypothetical protein [Rhodoferax koreense]APW40215.1 hypothetical protein RD110_25940 [Rhodoferax koreense]
MQYQKTPVSLAWSDAKGAAVYFDHVVPADMVETMARDAEGPQYAEVLRSILPPSLCTEPTASNLTGLAPQVTQYLANYLVAFPHILGIEELPQGESMEDRARKQRPAVQAAYTDYVKATGIDPQLMSIYGVNLLSGAKAADAEVSLVLSNLDLIDTSRLSWAQIIELRRDQASRTELQRLRGLVYEKYTNFDPAFIRDKLQQDIEAYAKTTKFWDFPTRRSVYTIGLSGGVSTAFADALGLAIFGAPIGTAVVGATAALGGIAIAVESRRREIALLKDKNLVAYLIRAQKLAQGQ